MENGADANLKIVLGAGKEHGVDEVDFTADRNIGAQDIVSTTAGLQGEAVLADHGELRIHMHSANQQMAPGRKAMARGAGADVRAAGVRNVLSAIAAEDSATPSGDQAAFEAKPFIEIVGK
jgi:hypothetical protein